MRHSNCDSDAPVNHSASDTKYRPELVLVVGSSRIGNVVVSRIAELAGLKPLVATPESAGVILSSRKPGTVILDGGADDLECDEVLKELAAIRSKGKSSLPIVILLSNSSNKPSAPQSDFIDAVVLKPVNPDRLQPLILNLLAEARN